MRIDIQTTEFGPFEPPRIGFVYPVKGGRGLKHGHLQILFSITPPEDYNGRRALLIVINKEGVPVGVNSYGMHYIEDLQPIAFVEGLDEITLTMRSL